MTSKYTTEQITRFNSNIVKPHNPHDCWEWTGYTNGTGYGRMRVMGRKILAHRISWELHNQRDIPDGLCVLHTCDNRKCVNPEHLWLGTYLDNAQDKETKGRGNQPKGMAQRKAKLTDEQVLEIRRRYVKHSKDNNTRTLGKEFGVYPSQIAYIVARKVWKHL